MISRRQLLSVFVLMSALLNSTSAEEPLLQRFDRGTANGLIVPCSEELACDGAGDTACGCSLFSGGCEDGFLERLGLDVSAYLQQSVNTNSRNPRNPPTGAGNWPGAGWMYRNDEYMLNRAYFSVTRTPDTSNGQWDIGGAVDVLYGTDYQFLQSRGLETHKDFTNKWNSDNGSGLFGVGLMGVALPQAYFQIANDKVSIKLGHFYHPLGFERLDRHAHLIGNTGTYSVFYGEFLPVTGAMADLQLTDHLTISGGIHQGNGVWTDNNDNLNGFVGCNWSDEDTLVSFVADVGAEDDAGRNDQYIQSIVFQQAFGDGWLYIFHTDYGFVQNGAPGGSHANWYSIINTIGYTFSEKFTVGARYELFDDDDGARVAPAPGSGVWHAAGIGGTYKICPNLWLRPEFRWDRFDADSGVGPGPFKNGTERDQFLASFSVFLFL